jgi:hypothetical protein
MMTGSDYDQHMNERINQGVYGIKDGSAIAEDVQPSTFD